MAPGGIGGDPLTPNPLPGGEGGGTDWEPSPRPSPRGRGGGFGAVGCDAVWGFGDGCALEGDAVGECCGEGVGDVFGDVFGGGVDGVEGWVFVEVGVVEGGDDFVEVGFEFVEVEEEAVGVEGGAFDGDGDAPVVAVEGLAGALHGDGVGGAEFCLECEFVHGE